MRRFAYQFRPTVSVIREVHHNLAGANLLLRRFHLSMSIITVISGVGFQYFSISFAKSVRTCLSRRHGSKQNLINKGARALSVFSPNDIKSSLSARSRHALSLFHMYYNYKHWQLSGIAAQNQLTLLDINQGKH